MGIKSRISNRPVKTQANDMSVLQEQLLREERNYRADRLNPCDGER